MDINTRHHPISTLSVSSTDTNFQCRNIVDDFMQMQKACTVYDTKSVIPTNNPPGFQVQRGCRIIMNELIPKHTWLTLKNKYSLQCGHVDIRGGYNGCTSNFYSPSQCPG